MNRLPAAESLEFGAHCLICRPCAAAVEDAREFVHAMKGAARSLAGTPEQPHRTRRKATRSDFSWFVSFNC